MKKFAITISPLLLSAFALVWASEGFLFALEGLGITLGAAALWIVWIEFVDYIDKNLKD